MNYAAKIIACLLVAFCIAVISTGSTEKAIASITRVLSSTIARDTVHSIFRHLKL